MNRDDLIEPRISQLVANFGRYVRAYDEQPPFTGEQLAAHRETIALRRRLGSVRAAVNDHEFIASLRRTLRKWGIGVRASRLVPEAAFAAALQAAGPHLATLEPLVIDAPHLPIGLPDHLWSLIESLGVVENKAKLVAGAKTLHHLLPDLVVPMDRGWTGMFYELQRPQWQDPRSQRKIFYRVYADLTAVARRVHPQQYVTDAGWRTSRTKILDNALIGYCRAGLGDQPLEGAE